VAKFLTDEWALQASTACNGSDDVRNATRGVDLTLQQTVADTAYTTRINDGTVAITIADAPDADIEIALDYETAAEMDCGDINPQAAYMQGRLKITGNMGKLLHSQDAVNAIAKVLATLETDY
jgi:putative sterol carrier protein